MCVCVCVCVCVFCFFVCLLIFWLECSTVLADRQSRAGMNDSATASLWSKIIFQPSSRSFWVQQEFIQNRDTMNAHELTNKLVAYRRCVHLHTVEKKKTKEKKAHKKSIATEQFYQVNNK